MSGFQKKRPITPIISSDVKKTKNENLKPGHHYVISIDNNNNASSHAGDNNVLPDSFIATYDNKKKDTYIFNIADVTKPNYIELNKNDIISVIELPPLLVDKINEFIYPNTLGKKFEVNPVEPRVISNVGNKSFGKYRSNKPKSKGNSGGKTKNKKYKNCKTKRVRY